MSRAKENAIPNSDKFRTLHLDPRNILRGKQCIEMQGQRREKLEKRNSMWNDNQAATSGFMAGGWTGTTLVFAILAAVYIRTMHPSLPGGDAGELILAAHELGVAHPPGYPLYTILLKLVILVCPCGSVAWKANLFSAVCSAAAGGLLFRTVYLMTGCLAPGLLAAGMFGFSRLTWSWSVGAEVFALNNLLLGMLLLMAVQFNSSSLKDRVKISKVGALICGLCLTNQHTSVVYVAVLAVWVLFILHREQMLSLNILVQVTMYFTAGLLPYLYLPLSAFSKKARSTWGDQSSFSGFFVHLLRREYGTLDLLKDHKGQGFFWGIWAYIEHVATDLTPAVLFFAVMILFSLYHKKNKEQRHIVLIFLVMLTLYTAFFAWRANLDIQSPLFLGVVERFWMQSDFVLILLAAVAFHDVVRMPILIPKHIIGRGRCICVILYVHDFVNCYILAVCSIISHLIPVQSWHVDLVFAILLVFLQVRLNLPLCDSSRNLVVHDFAVASLSAFPKDAVVLTEGDLPSNSFRFFHLVEQVRPDLTIVDQEMLTYDWSIPMLEPHLPGLIFPGDQMFSRSGISADNKKLFTFRQLLDANFDKKPLYGCIGVQDHEPSWKETYELRPFGVCDQFVKKGTKFKLEEWLRASQKFSANWTHPFPESDSSWEDVASSEMWRAKTVAGLYLMEKAEYLDDQYRKANWLRKAYQVFKEAMESHKHFPAYWHKNFALVCDKLRHFSSHSEKINLVKTTVIHFKAYLNADVVDHDKEAIQDAIYKLQDYLKVMQGE